MTDNYAQGGTGEIMATDNIGGVNFQRVKIAVGADGVAADLSQDSPLPVSITDFNLNVAKGLVTDHTVFHKFGRNSDIDAGPEDIWVPGGVFTGFPTGAAETMEIFSSSADDDVAGTGALTVEIYNLLDGDGESMPNVIVTLTGVTPVSLGAQTYYRGGSRMRVLTAGSGGGNAGTLTLRHTTTTANIFAVMGVGLNQTSIAAFTVPVGYELYVNRIVVKMSRASGADGSASLTLRERAHGGVFQAIRDIEVTQSSSYIFENNGYLALHARDDIKISCESVSDTNTIIVAEFEGVLVAD